MGMDICQVGTIVSIVNYKLVSSRPKKPRDLRAKMVVFSLVALLLFGLPATVLAANTGLTNPTAHANVLRVGSTVNWQNTVNVLTSNDVYATAIILGNTHYLVAKGFGFSIPNTAVIKGIEVTVEKKSNQPNRLTDLEVNLVKDGTTPAAQNKADGAAWPTTDTITTYGGPNDLWQTTWTPAEINNLNFGVAFAAKSIIASSPPIGSVDNIKVNVYYNTPPVANDNNFVIDSNTGLIVVAPGILVNDDDDDGDTLTASLVTGTTNGVLALNANGGFTYTPNLDFVGTDQFTYQAFDGTFFSNIATVTIVVIPEGTTPLVGGLVLPVDFVVLVNAGMQAATWWIIPAAITTTLISYVVMLRIKK